MRLFCFVDVAFIVVGLDVPCCRGAARVGSRGMCCTRSTNWLGRHLQRAPRNAGRKSSPAAPSPQ
eukprot:10849773-Lingulodinium_polyedra.AAC.1